LGASLSASSGPRALEVHTPGLVQSTVDANGKQIGAQVASIGLGAVPQNDVVAYTATVDNFVPCALHGTKITSFDWSLSVDGLAVDLQGGRFLGTLSLGWPDPPDPVAGSYGASLDSADVPASS
jgi:hypothetical protein